MSQVVTQEISVVDRLTETLTYGGASSVNIQLQESSPPSYSFVNGTTTGGIDLHFEKYYTLSSAASTTLTLSSLTDDQGRTIAFVKVRKLAIHVTSKTGSDYLTVGGAASNPWTAWGGGTTPTFTVRNYDLKVANDATSFAVASGSSDQLKITNSGSASMTFIVNISGTSA